MGHVDAGGADALMQPLDLDAHLHTQLGVEIRQRLVEQEHGRLAHDGAAHRHALALAARELARLALQEIAELQDLRRLLHARLDLGLRHAADAQPVGHVVVDRHVRIKRVVLEHHRDVAILGLQLVDDAPADGDLAARDRFEPGDHPQQGRLPATRRAENDDELAVYDLAIDAVNDLHAVVGLADASQADACHCALIPWITSRSRPDP